MEPPGCSFNPPFEAHRDSLAESVADEMQKIYRAELGPQLVPHNISGKIMTEEDVIIAGANHVRIIRGIEKTLKAIVAQLSLHFKELCSLLKILQRTPTRSCSYLF